MPVVPLLPVDAPPAATTDVSGPTTTSPQALVIPPPPPVAPTSYALAEALQAVIARDRFRCCPACRRENRPYEPAYRNRRNLDHYYTAEWWAG